MAAYNIEVVPEPNGEFRWQIISHDGRVLYRSWGLTWPCSLEAFNAAKLWRWAHMQLGYQIDDYDDLPLFERSDT